MNSHLKEDSANSKTGEISTTSYSRESCCLSCPLHPAHYENGKSPCYAAAGYHTARNWDRITAGTWSTVTDEEEHHRRLAALPDGSKVRLAVMGEAIPHSGPKSGRIRRGRLASLADAVAHVRAFTYTHLPLTAWNIESLRQVRDRLTVNLSANNEGELPRYKRTGLPVAVTVPADDERVRWTTADGIDCFTCPQQTRGLQCADCMLCAVGHPSRPVIAFRAHGKNSDGIGG